MFKGAQDKKKWVSVPFAVIISLVLISSVTCVPHIHGSTVTQGLDEESTPGNLSFFLSPGYQTGVSQAQYMMAVLTHQISEALYSSRQGLDVTRFHQAASTISRGTLNETASLSVLGETAALMATHITGHLHSPTLSPRLQGLLTALQGILDHMASLVGISLEGTITPQQGDPTITPWVAHQNLVGQGLMNLVLLVIMVILFLLDGGFIAIILGAANAILSGIIFILGAIASTLVLLIMGLQGVLSLAAIFVLLLGLVSKVAINVLATLGGPLLGFVTWKLVGILGTVLGHISLGVLSGAALLLLLGLPIALLVILRALIQDGNGDTTPILAVILELIFSVLIKIPGLEEPLENLWDWLGERIDNWPPWPFDTTPPVISNVVDSPDPQGLNGYVNITCMVTDTSGVHTVKVNITSPDTTTINVSMTQLGSTATYYHNATYSQLGSHTYFIWANDTRGAHTTSSSYSFSVIDNVPPVISGITDEPDPQVSGGTVYINCTVTDAASAISTVKVNITGPVGFPPVSRVMKSTGGGAYTNSSVYTVPGQYAYHIFAKDSANNIQISENGYFTITATLEEP